MQDIIQQTFLSNRVLDYLIAAGFFVAGFVFIKIIKCVVLRRLKKLAEKTATTIDDFVVENVQIIAVPLAYFGVFYLSLNTLKLHELLKKGVDTLGIAIVTLFTARLAVALVTYGFSIYQKTRGGDSSFQRSLNGILKVVRVVIWGLAIFFFLDNLGFKISAIVAGLGIGGIAIALAAQAVLKDLFSYFAILFDKPFEVGDFIIIEKYLGTIEHIGIKTTRVRSLGGEQLVFSNTDLTNSRIRNYKRMQKRRVLFKLGVTYQTTSEQLKTIPGIIKKVVENVKDATFDRAHFASYGDFSLNIEIVYYILTSDYNKYMDIQQEINLALKQEFEKHKIDFAYPTQTLFVNK